MPPAVLSAPSASINHEHGGGDCPFYQAAWQVFLYATKPIKDDNGNLVPRFVASPDFLTIEQAFGSQNTRDFPKKQKGFTLSLGVRSVQRTNSADPKTDPAIAAGVQQAKSLSPVVDQNGNPLFYAIHFNRTMRDFFAQPDASKPQLTLLTQQGLQAAQQDPEFKNLEFPQGCIEIKSAWQLVDGASARPGYFVVTGGVPHLSVDGMSRLVSDPTPVRVVPVALVAIHVVFTLKDHPEFVWSSFEHVDGSGNADTAPSAKQNPSIMSGPTEFVSTPVKNFLLFKNGTQFGDANKVVTSQDIMTRFDVSKQTFNNFQTSIYRMYPASKAGDTTIDSDVQAVNDSMAKVFATAPGFDPQVDPRGSYRLVGGVWMDNPRADQTSVNPKKKFVPNMSIDTIDAQGMTVSPDDPKSPLAGEDRMSSTALESFTQLDPKLDPVNERKAIDQPNCFACHNSRLIPGSDDVGTLLKPSKLNVSHILSRYLLNAPPPVPSH